MSQISPPMRIILVGAVVLAAAWVLFLKPGGSTDTATPAATPAATPGLAGTANGPKAKTGLGRAVQAAHGASDKSDAANAAAGSQTSPPATGAVKPSTSAATTPQPATTTPAAGAKPADALLAKLPKWLQKNLDHKVVALMFTNDKAADDRRTHQAFKRAYTAHGKVVIRSVPVTKISRYGPVTQGVNVQQTPTIMVIDRDRHANTLVGYSSLDSINQAIIDGLLATDQPVKHVAYLRKLEGTCSDVRDDLFALTPPSTQKAYVHYVDRAIVRLDRLDAKVAALTPPVAYRGVDRQVKKVLAVDSKIFGSLKAAAHGNTVDTVAFRATAKKDDKLWGPLSLDLAAAGLDECR